MLIKNDKFKIACIAFSSYNIRKSTNKPPTLEVICESHIKPGSYGTANTICPCSTNTRQIQRQLASENRMLWATLTPHGTTRHYISEPMPYRHEEHYEVIDSDSIRRKFHTNINHSASSSPRRIPIKVNIYQCEITCRAEVLQMLFVEKPF